MIKPHGSDELNPLFVYDTARRHALIAEAETLPSLLLNSAAAANAVMLGGGYFNPLTGYMNLADALSVAQKSTTAVLEQRGDERLLASKFPRATGLLAEAREDIDRIQSLTIPELEKDLEHKPAREVNLEIKRRTLVFSILPNDVSWSG